MVDSEKKQNLLDRGNRAAKQGGVFVRTVTVSREYKRKTEAEIVDNGFNFSKLGRMIDRAVKEAMDLNSHEFKNIKEEIKTDLGKAKEDIKEDFGRVKDDFGKIKEDLGSIGKEFRSEPPKHSKKKYQHRDNAFQKGEPPHRSYGYHQQNPDSPYHETLPAVKAPSVNIAGILLVVFGGIGLGILALITTVLLITTLFMGIRGAAYLAGALVLALFYCAAGSMLWKGIKLCGRTKRFRKYLQEIKGGDFCPIGMLAAAINKSEEFVVKDLKKMIRKGMFPTGYLDKQETCLILNSETYRQYLYAEEEMQRRQKEEEERKKQREAQQKREEEERKKRAAQRGSNEELNTVINDGYQYICQIREANAQIPGEEISKKITHLETVTTKIFEYVEQHPNKLPEIRKFMSYYLPTTLKLLKAYQEFDRQPVQGENIMTAKGEIQATLDKINVAFENLLDHLFGDEVLDISTDISVLESMLAQEGLTGSDFKS